MKLTKVEKQATVIILLISWLFMFFTYDFIVARCHGISLRIMLFVLLQLLLIKGLEAIFNVFYVRWQRKHH